MDRNQSQFRAMSYILFLPTYQTENFPSRCVSKYYLRNRSRLHDKGSKTNRSRQQERKQVKGVEVIKEI